MQLLIKIAKLLVPLDQRVMATVPVLVNTFNIFHVNTQRVSSNGQPLGVAIGRYAEDVYDGGIQGGNGLGNPWFLCTAAIGEYLYRVAGELLENGNIVVTPLNKAFYNSFLELNLSVGTIAITDAQFKTVIMALVGKGDAFIRRVMNHSNNGALPEQFNRDTGIPQGARDLTWSYASIITANKARDFSVMLMLKYNMV